MKALRYPAVLFWLFIALFLITTINISHPNDFILEHIPTLVLAIILLYTYNKFRLSNTSYTLIFVFMLFHLMGAHYTYSEVPYDNWLKTILGTELTALLGFSRNHYDRLVHLLFGLLILYPIKEVFMRVASAKKIWGYAIPIQIVMCFSMFYELVEWGAAIVFGGDLGISYLGTQGDVWDAQKDMFLASIGALISAVIIAFIENRKHKTSRRKRK